MTPTTILLVLPRIDHLQSFAPLVRALAADGRLRPVVVTSAGLDAGEAPATVLRRPFYLAAGRGRVRWLRFMVARERAARQVLDETLPAAVVVPSDVSDATLPYVAGAQARGVPVVYVQGTEIFPDYVEVNRRFHAARHDELSPVRRIGLQVLEWALRAAGIHGKLSASEVIGSRAEVSVVANDTQRQVLLAGGVPADRIHVMGAPFVDRLVALRRDLEHDRAAAMRAELGLDSQRTVLVITKDLCRLGFTDRAGQHRVVASILDAIDARLPGWDVLVKLHPTERAADYSWALSRANRPRIVTEGAAEDLLLICGLSVSLGTSSPALAARFLGTPVVVFAPATGGFLDAHVGLFPPGQVVASDDELRGALSRTATGRASARPYLDPTVLGLTDGHASERIVGFLYQWVTARPAEGDTSGPRAMRPSK